MQVSLQVRPLAYAMNYSMSLSIAERLKTLRLCVGGLTANFDNSSVATYTRRIRNAQHSHISIFMSQIFHMPLLLSYFQAAHCLRALIVLLCASSCSCLLLQFVVVLSSCLPRCEPQPRLTAAPTTNSPFPVQAAIQSQLV